MMADTELDETSSTYFLATSNKPKPYVSFGVPFADACKHHAEATFHASRAYVIVSSSISKTKDFAALKDALGDKVAAVRYGIRQHVPWPDVLEVAAGIRDSNADLIITLGAGSLTDAAKVASFAVANGAYTLEALNKLHIRAKPDPATLKPCTIPIINIPTSLSGGEYNSPGGATDWRNHRKTSFQHPSIGTWLVILDPALVMSTPERVWLSSGMRAVDHCIEGFCSVAFRPSPAGGDSEVEKKKKESEKHLSKGLELLLPSLLITRRDPSDLEARRGEMLGVIEALRGLSMGVPMGASHGIGHQLGPLGVGHGETSCVMLPSVLEWNLKHGDDWVRERQRLLLELLWRSETVAERLTAKGLSPDTAHAGEVVRSYVEELGLPTTLSTVGVGRDQFGKLAASSMTDRYIPTNPVTITETQQVMDILEMAL